MVCQIKYNVFENFRLGELMKQVRRAIMVLAYRGYDLAQPTP